MYLPEGLWQLAILDVDEPALAQVRESHRIHVAAVRWRVQVLLRHAVAMERLGSDAPPFEEGKRLISQGNKLGHWTGGALRSACTVRQRS